MSVTKIGRSLALNGELFDFSQMIDGDTLPKAAIDSIWFDSDVSMIGGELELTLLMPIPANYSQEQAFPVPLLIVADGPVALPQPLPAQRTDPEIETSGAFKLEELQGAEA